MKRLFLSTILMTATLGALASSFVPGTTQHTPTQHAALMAMRI